MCDSTNEAARPEPKDAAEVHWTRLALALTPSEELALIKLFGQESAKPTAEKHVSVMTYGTGLDTPPNDYTSAPTFTDVRLPEHIRKLQEMCNLHKNYRCCDIYKLTPPPSIPRKSPVGINDFMRGVFRQEDSLGGNYAYVLLGRDVKIWSNTPAADTAKPCNEHSGTGYAVTKNRSYERELKGIPARENTPYIRTLPQYTVVFTFPV
jgi:hypothetical protein